MRGIVALRADMLLPAHVSVFCKSETWVEQFLRRRFGDVIAFDGDMMWYGRRIHTYVCFAKTKTEIFSFPEADGFLWAARTHVCVVDVGRFCGSKPQQQGSSLGISLFNDFVLLRRPVSKQENFPFIRIFLEAARQRSPKL